MMANVQKNTSAQVRLTSPGGSFTKYRRAVTGNKGLIFFLFYELLTTFVAPIPGKTGVLLRQLLYPLLFKEFGKNVVIDSNVVFRNPECIRLADNVHIDSHCSLDVKGEGKAIIFAEDVHLGKATIVSCTGGEIQVGKACRVGREGRLGSFLGLSIGEHCVLEDFCYCVGAGHNDKDLTRTIIDQEITCKGPTIIGQRVSLGCCSTVLDGVTIEDDSIILPNSLVAKNVPGASTVSGVPAKSILA